MFAILMMLLGASVVFTFYAGAMSFKELRANKKTKAFEPYVVGVNKFLIPHKEWRALLTIELNKMTHPHAEFTYPEDYILLEPLKDPNPPVDRSRQYSGGANDHTAQRIKENIEYRRKADRIVRQRSNIELLTPRYGSDHSLTYNELRNAANRYGLGYTKECEKCLQPTLTDVKQQFCRVCTNNMAEVKRINQMHDDWVIDTSYKPVVQDDLIVENADGKIIKNVTPNLTFVRYINKRTGEYKMEALSTGNARLKELSAMSRKDLWDEAEGFGLDVDGMMTKGDLISAIRSAELEMGIDQTTGIEVGAAAVFVGTMTKEELYKKTKVKLFEFADTHNIPTKSRMTKAELVDVIHDALNAPVEEESQFEIIKKRADGSIVRAHQVPGVQGPAGVDMTKEQSYQYGDYMYEALMGKHHRIPYVPLNEVAAESIFTGAFDFGDL